MKNKIFALFYFLFIICSIYSDNISYFNKETTRLKGTAGAGIASVLIDEATILNPSTIAFYNIGSVYLEKKSNSKNDDKDYSVIVSDGKGNLKGSFNYTKSTTTNYNVNFFAMAMAFPMGKTSAIGINYQIQNIDFNNGAELTFNQINAGIIHAISKELTLGIVANDITNEISYDRRIIAGVQYVLKKYITIMFDAGIDYTMPAYDTSIYKGAIQVKALNSIYFRYGVFKDSAYETRGSGFGVALNTPKMLIEFSIKSTFYDKINKLIPSRETNFGISYRF